MADAYMRVQQVDQRTDPLAGMGGAGPDPAALLRLLLTYGRLEEAAALAVSYLDYWDKQARMPVPESDAGPVGRLQCKPCFVLAFSSVGPWLRFA